MLGATLVDTLRKKYDVYATSSNNFKLNQAKNFLKFDLAKDNFQKLISWSKPNVIIHCAALTNLDYCEINPEETKLINTDSIKRLLEPNKRVKLIFISTDAVFSDSISNATEEDQIDPQSIYGKSKYNAEKYLLNDNENHLVIRTTIVGKNINIDKQSFVEWIITSLKNNKKITLFSDSYFSPITIWDLANEIDWVLSNNISGLFHISGIEPISKYSFGMKICNRLGLDSSLIQKGSIENFTFVAKRSKNQTLNSSLYMKLTKRRLPSIKETINQINYHFNETMIKHASSLTK